MIKYVIYMSSSMLSSYFYILKNFWDALFSMDPLINVNVQELFDRKREVSLLLDNHKADVILFIFGLTWDI